VLAIAFAEDHIVPVGSAQPLIDLVGSRDKQLLVDRGGHVGAVVSRKAAERLWPRCPSSGPTGTEPRRAITRSSLPVHAFHPRGSPRLEA